MPAKGWRKNPEALTWTERCAQQAKRFDQLLDKLEKLTRTLIVLLEHVMTQDKGKR